MVNVFVDSVAMCIRLCFEICKKEFRVQLNNKTTAYQFPNTIAYVLTTTDVGIVLVRLTLLCVYVCRPWLCWYLFFYFFLYILISCFYYGIMCVRTKVVQGICLIISTCGQVIACHLFNDIFI